MKSWRESSHSNVRFQIIVVVAIFMALLGTPSVFAAAPGPRPNTVVVSSGRTKHYAVQNPAWLAQKMGYRIKAHGKNLPFAFQSPLACAQDCPPTSLSLYYSMTQKVMEPGNGSYPNSPGGSSADYAGNHYSDNNMFNLCGPGAADTALYYWPVVPNALGTATYTDESNGVRTTWGSDRYRSYLARLAWQIQPPGWTPGMMDTAHNPSAGTTLYDLRDGMNWEASGENTSNWSNFFYAIRWHDDSGVTSATLHSDITTDIWNGGATGVGVVAEVNAQLMPNWTNQGFDTKHFITIIGYDDTPGHQVYYYEDTCGNVTGCGSNSNAGLLTVSQTTLWTAIKSVPVNKSTAYNAGDGGWIW